MSGSLKPINRQATGTLKYINTLKALTTKLVNFSYSFADARWDKWENEHYEKANKSQGGPLLFTFDCGRSLGAGLGTGIESAGPVAQRRNVR